MLIDTAALALLTATASCGGPKQTATIVVDPPASVDDHGCIGVVGFELAIRVGGTAYPIEQLMRDSPVLSPSDCRLPGAASLSDLPTDQPVEIAIDGYDSERIHRIAGDLQMDQLGDATSHLVLAGVASASTESVFVVNRAALFPGTALSDIQSFSVHTAQKNTSLLDFTVTDQTRPWFTAVDPGAFTMTMAIPAGETLVVTITSAGGGGPPARVTPKLGAGGLYYTAP
jgi:hypothetical protein